MKRILTLLLAALAALALPPAPARAHASLARSEPESGAVLAQTPAVLRLEFTERLDPAFSRVQLVDQAGAVLASVDAVDPEAPYTLELTPPALPQGSYTALWRVRSSEDGHVTEGAVPFGVGAAADLGVALPPVGAPAPAMAPPPAMGVLGRWLALAGAALAAGALCFAQLVWRPVWRAQPGAPAADGAAGRGLRQLVVAGCALVLLSGPPTLLSQAASAAGPGGSALAALPRLLDDPGGLLVVGRLLLAAALGGLALRLTPPGGGSAAPWRAGLAVGALLLLTFPLTSHAAAAGERAPALIANGAIHTIAMAVWLGGLPPLLAAAGRSSASGPPLRALVQRFTPLAMGAVLAIAVSGAGTALEQIGSPDLLPATTYGRALVAKSAAFAALIGLGALHWLVVGPRLRPGGGWARHFRATLGAEILLGLAVLAAAGVQLSSAPSKAALTAQAQIGQRLEAAAEAEAEADMVLWVTPGNVGDNLLALDVPGEGSAAAPAEVLFRVRMPGMEMGTLEARATEVTPGRFQARGNYLSMSGRWTVEAIVRRAGTNDVRHTFVVDVARR